MRAIPTAKVLADVEADPYIPQFGMNRKGMQPGPPIEDPRCRAASLEALHNAIRTAKQLAKLGVHKEDVNRYLQPWTWTRVVISGNDEAWANFLALRAHTDAYAPLRGFAMESAAAIAATTPTPLDYGEWHLPYAEGSGPDAIKQSVARCARVSYRSLADPEKISTLEEDLALYDRLLGGDPKHASPAEHQATPAFQLEEDSIVGRFGTGWIVHRHQIPNERHTDLSAQLRRLGFDTGGTQ
jgi:thymidylate synthase ThyX